MYCYFIAAVSPPACDPDCGDNAHCVYGQNNACKCNKGFTGNPYIKCLPRRQITCAKASCGLNAVCQQTKSHVECLCPPGYLGNPNLQCTDIDECSSKPCAENAICINTPGSFSCICKSRYVGNPYELCSQVSISKCTEGSLCTCSHNATCPEGYTCQRSKCVDVCHTKICGPQSICEEGLCHCLPGHNGNPNDLQRGCVADGKCMVDGDCKDSEICFQVAKNTRKCVDSCTKLQCGPNSLCIGANHQAHCICAEGYVGNPIDVKTGCHLQQRDHNEEECRSNTDCLNSHVCIEVEGSTKKCLDLCSTIACSANEHCKVVENSARCDCKDGFLWNPVSSICEQPSTPNCNNNADCDDNESCQKDVLGVKKCEDSCSLFTCPQNSRCISKNHKSQCECLPGFIGNPNDRDGCITINKNQCTDDAQCRESEICKNIGDLNKCLPACQQITCGPNAICVSNNHAPKCQCPSGPFTGNPDDLEKGCQSVPCIYNDDCLSHELCNRLTHTCMDVCLEDSCGENAVCIAENHKTICQCPSGYRSDPVPEVGCKKIEACNPNPCHSTAVCEPRHSSYVCLCPSGFVGDPKKTGCRKQSECSNGNQDCPLEATCVEGRCVNPCEGACGINSLCKVVNRKPICICPDGYENFNGNSCKKKLLTCTNELDCDGDVCSNGQCFAACKDSSQCDLGDICSKNLCTTQCSKHVQCGIGEACVESQCLIGCRSNEECPSEEACINNKCVNPCSSTKVCGPNAICSRINHSTKCECPLGFQGTPSPQQGCVRKPSSCERTSDCPPDHMCIGLLCQVPCKDNSGCAIGEKCSDNKCHKICHSSSNCLHGEHCSSGLCVPGCKIDSDCLNNQFCKSSICQCSPGFELNGDECVNINECINNSCHPTAQCVDTPGSYKCVCPVGAVGDPYKTGCLLPNQCRSDYQCEDSLACLRGKCSNPCQSKTCGSNAVCSVLKHRVTCACEKGYLGNPFDMNIGCFKVECVDNSDCSGDKYCNMRSNKCSG